MCMYMNVCMINIHCMHDWEYNDLVIRSDVRPMVQRHCLIESIYSHGCDTAVVHTKKRGERGRRGQLSKTRRFPKAMLCAHTFRPYLQRYHRSKLPQTLARQI